jgi:hypothetical protein
LKRLIMLAVLSLAAVPLFALTANGQAPVTASDVQIATSRGFTELVTAKTTPKRDRTRPYTFTTVGKIVPPPRFCAPGTGPTAPAGGGNCIPLICPAGSTNPAYCAQPPRSVICSGIVTVRFQRHSTTVSSRNVNLLPDCTYRSRVSFTTNLRSRRGVLRVRARFQGNVVLTPQVSATRTVRAG